MQNFKKILLIAVVFIMLLSACSTEDTPTVDPNEIYTQAAQTVSAQRTSTAQAEMPAAEPGSSGEEIDVNAIYTQAAQTVVAEMTAQAPLLLPTQTPLEFRPTATPIVQNVDPNNPQPTPIPPTPVPTNTAKVQLEDKASFLYQYPGDDFEFNPGSKFDAVFQFKNIGENTWTPAYTLRWYAGDKLGDTKLKYTFDDAGDNKTVGPNEVVEIKIIGLTAPAAPGTYQSNWRLCNDHEPYQCFYLVYLQIIVK